MSVLIVVDRIEEGLIVCERTEGNKKDLITIEKTKTKGKIKEGDALKIDKGIYIKDKEKTKELTESIEDMTKDLWEN